MGFWGTLGHAALRYGPYVAAPFTGGASLALAPYTTMADAAWTGIAAAKAKTAQDEYAKKLLGQSGLGPSGNFSAAAYGSPASYYNQIGQEMPKGTGTSAFGWGGNTMQGMGYQPPADPSQSGGGMNGGGYSGGRGFRVNDDGTMSGGLGPRSNPMNQVDQSNPNLSLMFGQGRSDAIRNQGFRGGYPVFTQSSTDPNATPFTTNIPRIGYGGGRSRDTGMWGRLPQPTDQTQVQ